MPVISFFFGISIRMYHNDHEPPHVHAEYQGFEAFVAIGSGEVLEGRLPAQAARLVREWCLAHAEELMRNWSRAKDLLPLERIPGADND
ncbi:DUF4160 domain-containing protein [Acidobacteria bacterium ACD]|nr:MAG: DUF4160 domain-containing protein [Acidobacteriota bacterium]MCE7957739.1 DUF4160 domain-containing protein [Acidobacteria bacterium ACB2]MDL1948443.1 DUF4160 domain-containing protein [Acidobacteria bacterium ACD]